MSTDLPPTVRSTRRSTKPDYKGRHVVERAFNKLKNWRGLATRYEHALTYRGGMVLASIVLWLQA